MTQASPTLGMRWMLAGPIQIECPTLKAAAEVAVGVSGAFRGSIDEDRVERGPILEPSRQL